MRATLALIMAAACGRGGDGEPAPAPPVPVVDAAVAARAIDAAAAAPLPPLGPPPEFATAPAKLATIAAGVDIAEVTFAPRGTAVAYIAKTGSRERVMLNDQAGPEFVEVFDVSLRFTSDERSVAYVGRSRDARGETSVVVDRAGAGPVYRYASLRGLRRDGRAIYSATDLDHYPTRLVSGDRRGPEFLSIEGMHDQQLPDDPDELVYKARDRDGKWYVVMGDDAGEPFDWVGAPQVAPGRHVAYEAAVKSGASLADAASFVVIDRVKRGPFKDVGEVCISARGVVAYDVADAGGSRVIGPQGEGPRYQSVMELTFSADGGRFAYIAHEAEGRDRVVVDGVPGPVFGDVKLDSLIFSPDGKRVAYAASRGSEFEDPAMAVVDGRGGPSHAQIDELTFDLTGRHVAYVAGDGTSERVVIDGRPGPRFDDVASLLPGDGTFYYGGRRGGKNIDVYWPGAKWFIVAGATVYGPYARINPNGYFTGNTWLNLVVSPDGRHVAYRVLDGEVWTLHVDGEPATPAEELIYPPVFSPDSRWVGYGAQRGRELWWLVTPASARPPPR